VYPVVHFGGLQGQCRYSVQVLPGPLLAIREVVQQSLAPIGAMVVASMHGTNDGQPAASEWDVFISHATEDKDDVVKPLACALQDLGIRVWYDEFELHLGDSLRRKTDGGLARCRFGVLVLSPSFFAKNWAQYELDSLVTREMTGEQTILPPLAQGWEGRGDLIQSLPS